MKNLLLIIIFCSTIWSCSNQTTDYSISTDNLKTKGNLIAQTDTNEIQINANFPFGCAVLVTFEYAKHWEGHEEGLVQPKGKEFENIGQCFRNINQVKTLEKKPNINELKHIKIGGDFLNTVYYDTISQQKIDSLKYRLPNIGQYQCYYFYEQSKNKYGEYGSLLLLDTKSKKGKTLNVYYEVGGDQHVNFRYFYVDGETIRIYEGSCYDDGCGLAERFTVNIKADGQVFINELK